MVNVCGLLPHNYSRPGVAWRSVNTISKIVVHYPGDSGDDQEVYLDRLKMLASYHLNKDWGGGWMGFGLMYHRVIAPDGTIYETEPLELITWNAHSPANEIDLAILIDVGIGQNVTVLQRAALLAYLEQLCYHTPAIPAGPHDVYGHREMPNNATDCPGPAFDLVTEWRRLNP